MFQPLRQLEKTRWRKGSNVLKKELAKDNQDELKNIRNCSCDRTVTSILIFKDKS